MRTFLLYPYLVFSTSFMRNFHSPDTDVRSAFTYMIYSHGHVGRGVEHVHERGARGEFGRGDDIGGVYSGEDGGGLGREEKGHQEQDIGCGQDVEGVFALAVRFDDLPPCAC